MADPDLQVREGGGHPDPEITEEPGLNRTFFRPFGPQFGLKVRVGGWPPGPFPWIHDGLVSVLRVVDCTRKRLSVKVNEQNICVRVGTYKELKLSFNSLSLQLSLDPIKERGLLRY